MYIEFQLGAKDGHGAAQANMIVNDALHEWSDQYNIPYNTKIVGYMKRVTFEQDKYYSLFAMTWNPDRKFYALGRWRIVSDLNNKIEFDSRV